MGPDRFATYGAARGVPARRDLDLPAICQRLRDSFSVASVVRTAGVDLKRAGREWKGLCPFHGERSPSFTVYADDRRFCCFGCGAEGDVIDFVRLAYGGGVLNAIERLDAGELQVLKGKLPPPARRSDTRAIADRIVKASSPIEGTPAETYLRSRGITIPLPHTLRFARLAPPKQPDDNGVLVANGPDTLPCLVGIVTDAGGRLTGLQRTYLTDNGRKAATTDGAVKYSLGDVRGGSIQLGPPASTIVITEGVEDGLSLLQALNGSVWVAAGTANLPHVVMPKVVERVVIGADGDAPGEAAAQKAAGAYAAAGYAARILRPESGFKDFNDELRGVRA